MNRLYSTFNRANLPEHLRLQNLPLISRHANHHIGRYDRVDTRAWIQQKDAAGGRRL